MQAAYAVLYRWCCGGSLLCHNVSKSRLNEWITQQGWVQTRDVSTSKAFFCWEDKGKDDDIHWTTFSLIFSLLIWWRPWRSKCPESVHILVLYFAHWSTSVAIQLLGDLWQYLEVFFLQYFLLFKFVYSVFLFLCRCRSQCHGWQW